MLNIKYEDEIDFEHVNDLNEAGQKLSVLTNLLNKVISVRQKTKVDLMDWCSRYPNEKLHKLSWENKLIALMGLAQNDTVNKLVYLFYEADEAYSKIKNKQDQVYEDINRLKKIMDAVPR